MKVIIQYEWEFTPKEWEELTNFHNELKTTRAIAWTERVKFDNRDTFHHMCQLGLPMTKLINVEK